MTHKPKIFSFLRKPLREVIEIGPNIGKEMASEVITTLLTCITCHVAQKEHMQTR